MKPCSLIFKCAVLLIIFFIGPSGAFASNSSAHVESISIDAAQTFLDNSITELAIKDTRNLLKKGFPAASVYINNPGAGIHIVVAGGSGKNSDEYEWVSSSRNNHVVLVLKSPSMQGLSSGLYGLLQEKLGYRFYHPRRT
ncbi:MAG: hypothetical protein HQL08_11840, partial [Nitrospirae bacterium]|nr:hypothetical protein [Nitrospirota bacterium]